MHESRIAARKIGFYFFHRCVTVFHRSAISHYFSDRRTLRIEIESHSQQRLVTSEPLSRFRAISQPMRPMLTVHWSH